MATYTSYDPKASEALSSPIGGLSNAVTQLGTALNLQTSTIVDKEMTEIYISEDDRRRIYTVDIENRGWLTNPAPTFKKNGVTITSSGESFEVNYLGGCIEFLNDNNRPSDTDVITVSATYVNSSSTRLTTIETNVSALQLKLQNYRGAFDSLSNLQSSITDAVQYDYAHVFGTVFDIYFYDSTNSEWVSVTENDVESLQTQINTLSNTKENSIGTKNTAFNKNFGTSNGEVMRGDYAYSKAEIDTSLSGKEDSIGSKGTAFNKDFGTVSGTVADGAYVAPIYTASSTFTDLTSGETTVSAFSKLKSWFSQISTNITNIASNASDILSLQTKVGTDTLTTTAQDLSGGLNELNSNFATEAVETGISGLTARKCGKNIQLTYAGTYAIANATVLGVLPESVRPSILVYTSCNMRSGSSVSGNSILTIGSSTTGGKVTIYTDTTSARTYGVSVSYLID